MPNSFATAAQQAPLSMGFPRQEYRSELPLPSPGDLPNPEIKRTSPVLADGFFTTEPPGKPAVRMHISNLFGRCIISLLMQLQMTTNSVVKLKITQANFLMLSIGQNFR